MKTIPVNEPLLDGKEKDYLIECIETGWISSEGPFVKEFEKQFSKRMGRKHGIAVCNGSAAIDIAVTALDIGPGDEVILPTFTIISCAASIIRAGAKPVLVDCDSKTWAMNTEQIEAKITDKTKAIMVVHIYGLPVDIEPVDDLSEKYGIAIIEDAAEAHGLTYRKRPCGSFGDISTFSFYPNKHVTTGEGGMLLTDNDRLATGCRSLRNLCFQTKKRFVHEKLGWNMRMSNLQAAVGLAQLERLNEFLGRKRKMGQRYSELLSDIPGIQLPVPETEYARNSYWVYGLVLGKNILLDADEAMRRLAQHGISTRPFFWPMHLQPVFKKMGLFENEHYPNAERIAHRGFYIPSGLAITDEQIKLVAEAVREVLT
jgi:perosamine synthetase